MLDTIARRFRAVAPSAAAWTLRLFHERSQHISVRRDVVEPVRSSDDLGAYISVVSADGFGYAATSDVSASGLSAAAAAALQWAKHSAGRSVALPQMSRLPASANFATRTLEPWQARPLADVVDLVRQVCRRLDRGSDIVDRIAAISHRAIDTLLIDAHGAVAQQFSYIHPYCSATANHGGESQTRSFARDGGRQGGFEQLTDLGFNDAPERVADEAKELLHAPNCPSGTMDVILLPTQMALQIHESIGHPLELDRILGDERNYAGTSFVTPDMFGSYRYGSELLNITFDPSVSEEYATYAFDDDGAPARREFLIKKGVLERGLGGGLSQKRSHISGVSNSRASSWNRPPIDRMANLNLESGSQPLDQLISGVERGVLMDSNRSWSIDDSRNKFQFGCEYGRLIENGRLGGVVKNPNYRGISATFWRNLTGVGDRTLVCGTPNCGKGEPNQVIHVGHASPPCRFAAVDVFGGG
jgi:predicted Zn-dependent protease